MDMGEENVVTHVKDLGHQERGSVNIRKETEVQIVTADVAMTVKKRVNRVLFRKE